MVTNFYNIRIRLRLYRVSPEVSPDVSPEVYPEVSPEVYPEVSSFHVLPIFNGSIQGC